MNKSKKLMIHRHKNVNYKDIMSCAICNRPFMVMPEHIRADARFPFLKDFQRSPYYTECHYTDASKNKECPIYQCE